MKIGILGAMHEEVRHLKNRMEVTEEKSMADRIYYSGKMDGFDVTLVFSRWGKVAASSTATTLINHFNVDFLLFTGVAGAVDSSLNIGDIVIANALYQHDMDARPIFPKFQIPLTTHLLFKPNHEHVKKAETAATLFLSKSHDTIDALMLESFSILKPAVHVGVIASGDKFVRNPTAHENLKLDTQKVLAVEMEGAAVAQVCHEHNVPYIIIRTISDKADHNATLDFQKFIDDIASQYSLGIVNEYLKSHFL